MDRGCDFAKIFHCAPVGAAAAAAGGWSGWFSGAYESAVDIAQGTRFHALAAFGSTAWDYGAVHGVGGLVEPFVLSFAAMTLSVIMVKN